MFWPDAALIGFLWGLHWMTLTDDGFRAEGLLALALFYGIFGTLFYYTIYARWQPRLFFLSGDKSGPARNEIGRVAWVNGIRTGLFQKVFFGWGEKCKERPEIYDQGYYISITYLIGSIMLFGTATTSYVILLFLEPTSTSWIVEVKQSLGWYASHRPFLLTLAVGLAARYFMVMSGIWFFRTWVVRGWPMTGRYFPWPGTAPASLGDLDPSDVKSMPLGALKMAGIGKYVVYVRPRRSGLEYLFNPIPWKFNRKPDSLDGGWTYTAMSHGEIAHHSSGSIYMKPSDHFLTSAGDWLPTAQGHIRTELNRAQRDVQLAVKTSAEDQRRQIYDNEVSITPNEDAWEKIQDYSPFHTGEEEYDE